MRSHVTTVQQRVFFAARFWLLQKRARSGRPPVRAAARRRSVAPSFQFLFAFKLSPCRVVLCQRRPAKKPTSLKNWGGGGRKKKRAQHEEVVRCTAVFLLPCLARWKSDTTHASNTSLILKRTRSPAGVYVSGWTAATPHLRRGQFQFLRWRCQSWTWKDLNSGVSLNAPWLILMMPLLDLCGVTHTVTSPTFVVCALCLVLAVNHYVFFL